MGKISFDSRLVEPGCTFVAIPGAKDDGAKYVRDAIAKGAAKIIVARDAELGTIDQGVEIVRTDNPRLELARLASQVFCEPSMKMRVFAVTGTNGKTTTAGIVRDILKTSGEECGLISTVEYSWPGHCEEASRTTPDALTLQRSFAEMLSAGCSAASIEASSHALDQDRLAATRLASAGFTNLTQDHFDYHHGFEDYFNCKRKLFKQLGELNPGAPAALNADDPYGMRLAEEAAELRVKAVAYSARSDAHAPVRAENIEADSSGTRFTLNAFGESRRISTALIGLYNVSNILCAAAMTIPLGIGMDAVASAVEALKPRWGRLEGFTAKNGARVFVDYAHSPDAIARVLAALRKVTQGRLCIVFGCGGDRDRAKRPLMAKAAAEGANFAIATSDNPRSEDPEAILDEVVSGFEGTSIPWLRIADRRRAIETAINDAQLGDTVAIVGKGHENYQEIGGVRHHFDDRETVRQLCR